MVALAGRANAQPTEIDAQCARSLALSPPNPRLIEENLRGYVVLLSAHFQGFVRDLCTEAAQVVTARVRPGLRPLILMQFHAQRAIDHGNPTLDNLVRDFHRFGINLRRVLNTDAANESRVRQLDELNKWRNVAAHHIPTLPPGLPLTPAALSSWRVACDELAYVLDEIVYNQLRKLLRRKPW